LYFRLCESVDLKKGFLVRLTTGQYINIALTTGQYGIYCPVGGFDPPTQWATIKNTTRARTDILNIPDKKLLISLAWPYYN